MAKVKNNFLFSNTLGDYSVYKMKGVEKICMRAKGGPSKHQIKTAPEFEEVRENNTEFGGCSTCTSHIYQSLNPIKQLADHNFFNDLQVITKFIQKLDLVNPPGERSILVSANRSLLPGFNLNNNHLFDSVVKAIPAYIIDRNTVSAKVTIPELIPGMNFMPPWNLPLFRFVVVLSIFPDMKFTADGYKPMNNQAVYRPVKAETDWMVAGSSQPAREMMISLNNQVIPDSSDTLMISIGIELSKLLTRSIIQPVANVGCAKVLGVG